MPLLHAPHDSTYGIASAQLASGAVVTAIIHADQRVLVTHDGGYSWLTVSGDGISIAKATSITYHPNFKSTFGDGAFLIGTKDGVWMLEPRSHITTKITRGLPPQDKWVIDLDSPTHRDADGPVIAVTEQGNVYKLDSDSDSWEYIFWVASMNTMSTKVAISPYAKKIASSNGDQDIFVSGQGVLYKSTDLGSNWSISPSFSNNAQSFFDWNISAIDFSDNYENDNTVIVGRGRMASSGLSDEGEIWVSRDQGNLFLRQHTLGTSVTALTCSPPDSSGKRYWFAAGRLYPNYGGYFGTGILRSEDNGITWSDNDSFQDFLLEDKPGKKSGAEEMFYFTELAVSGNFSQDNTLYYARQEGLFVSKDSGIHWKQQATRFANRFRDIQTAINANGDDLVFGAGYGTGAICYNSTEDTTQILPDRVPMVYQRRLSVSPNYHKDGRVLVAGNVYLYEWQSDEVPSTTPNLDSYWFTPEVRSAAIGGQRDPGYPRGVQYSPHFDGTGTTPGSDQTYFWYSAEGQVRRTSDNGLTSERLFETTLGQPTDTIQCLTIAPTYNANGTRTDVYAGANSGTIYRLESNDKWLKIGQCNSQIVDIKVSPDFNRPFNPRLFAILSKAPYVVELNDDPAGPSINTLRFNLGKITPTGIALHPEFETIPEIFLSTNANGIFSINLNASTPKWEKVGNEFPPFECQDIEISIGYPKHGSIYTATTNGILMLNESKDWETIGNVFRLDDTDETISTYSPNNPNVINGTHIWPWRSTLRWRLPYDLPGTGNEVLFGDFDNDYFECPVKGLAAKVLTYQAPNLGEIKIDLIDPDNGNIVNSITYDLNVPANQVKEVYLEIDCPENNKVYTLRGTALLDPGESIPLDGIEVIRF